MPKSFRSHIQTSDWPYLGLLLHSDRKSSIEHFTWGRFMVQIIYIPPKRRNAIQCDTSVPFWRASPWGWKKNNKKNKNEHRWKCRQGSLLHLPIRKFAKHAPPCPTPSSASSAIPISYSADCSTSRSSVYRYRYSSVAVRTGTMIKGLMGRNHFKIIFCSRWCIGEVTK